MLAWAVAGVPQRWQNLAPGVRDAPHAAHAAPASGAPQLEQNFPLAGLPQDAHVVVPSADEGETGEAMQKATRPLPSRQRV